MRTSFDRKRQASLAHALLMGVPLVLVLWLCYVYLVYPAGERMAMGIFYSNAMRLGLSVLTLSGVILAVRNRWNAPLAVLGWWALALMATMVITGTVLGGVRKTHAASLDDAFLAGAMAGLLATYVLASVGLGLRWFLGGRRRSVA